MSSKYSEVECKVTILGRVDRLIQVPPTLYSKQRHGSFFLLKPVIDQSETVLYGKIIVL